MDFILDGGTLSADHSSDNTTVASESNAMEITLNSYVPRLVEGSSVNGSENDRDPSLSIQTTPQGYFIQDTFSINSQTDSVTSSDESAFLRLNSSHFDTHTYPPRQNLPSTALDVVKDTKSRTFSDSHSDDDTYFEIPPLQFTGEGASQSIRCRNGDYLDDTISIDSCVFSYTSSDSSAFNEIRENRWSCDANWKVSPSTYYSKISNLDSRNNKPPTPFKRKLDYYPNPSSKRLHIELDARPPGEYNANHVDNEITASNHNLMSRYARQQAFDGTTFISATKEISDKIHVAKKQAFDEFMQWKATLVGIYSDPCSLLALSFRVDLNTLEKGEYWFNADCIYFPNESITARANLLGMVISEGVGRDKYVQLNGRKSERLNEQYSFGIDETVTIKVFQGSIFGLFNTTRTPYTNVAAGPTNLLLPYNKDLVHVGEITPEMTLKVNILGNDEVFRIDQFDDTYQVFYTDPISSLQEIYPYKLVELTVVSETVAIINFNYAYAVGMKSGYQMDAKVLETTVISGVNPFYF
ncbi:hypothetical protein HDV01_007093 [Terramyces sp. JEL0728]|nr:hypothetical protein HDV01_007093 [Terramyces sp. JEL0728]